MQLVYTTMHRLVERARTGQGPAFMECRTYRYRGHHVGDIDRVYYRSKEEERDWMTARDPLRLLAERLITQGRTDQSTLDRIHADVQAEIDAGVQFALNAPYPDVSEVNQHVYA